MPYFKAGPIGNITSLMVPPGESHQQKRNPRRRKVTLPTSYRKKKILIVEDEVLVAENLRESLEQKGYSVVAMVSTGEEAIQAVSKSEVDVILMDVRLAGALNGVETIHLIHESGKQIPVVFVTAYAEDLFPQVTTISRSFYRYISKPYDLESLEETIVELLSRP